MLHTSILSKPNVSNKPRLSICPKEKLGTDLRKSQTQHDTVTLDSISTLNFTATAQSASKFGSANILDENEKKTLISDNKSETLQNDGQTSEASEEKSIKKRVLKKLNLLLPHVCLITALLAYILLGAFCIQFLEYQAEIDARKQLVHNVTKFYDKIIDKVYEMASEESCDENKHRESLLPLLQSLSWAHEYDTRFQASEQLWSNEPGELLELWTFPTSVLYALTVATSTGYERVSPATNMGKLFTVAFGLVGIPMLFITAADIGKFLSEFVVGTYAYFLHKWQAKKNGCEKRDKNEHSKNDTVENHNGGTQLNGAIPGATQIGNGHANEGESHTITENRENYQNQENEREIEVHLPFWAYFGMMLAYCSLGSAIFNQCESGESWNFIYGFFFSYNAITTIGVGDVNARLLAYMCLVLVYVIVGLAVITMCVDLASSQAKAAFNKIHYWGKSLKSVHEQLSDEIIEALRLISAVKHKKAITLDDLAMFLAVHEKLNSMPYIPRNVKHLQWIEDAKSRKNSSSIDSELNTAFLDIDSTMSPRCHSQTL